MFKGIRTRETTNYLLQPNEKATTCGLTVLSIVLSTLHGCNFILIAHWSGFLCHPMLQIRKLKLGDLPKVTQ